MTARRVSGEFGRLEAEEDGILSGGMPAGHVALDAQRADLYDAVSVSGLTQGMRSAEVRRVTDQMPTEKARAFQQQAAEILPLRAMM